MYTITYSERAKKDLTKLKQNEPKYFQKAVLMYLLPTGIMMTNKHFN